MKSLVLMPALICIGCSKPPPTPPAVTEPLQAIHCTEHELPTFGVAGSPAESEQVALCACVWSHLGESDRKVAASLRVERVVSPSSMELFPSRFGKAIGDCTTAAHSPGQSPRLPAQARSLIEAAQNELIFSVASLWEVII